MKQDSIFERNPELTEYFKTSDGQAFYTESSANLHARSLNDKNVEHVIKEQEAEEEEVDDETKNYRTILEERYTELFGKAPAHNAADKTLEKRIAEKEAELAEEEVEDENPGEGQGDNENTQEDNEAED